MARSRGRWLGIGLIALGLIFLLDSTGALDIGEIFRTYWPLLLVLWGIALLVRPRRRGTVTAAVPAAVGAPAPGESLESANVFGDVNVRVTSPAFRGGSATTVFGDIVVDCRQAGLAEGEHTLSVSGVFGDSRVIVPPGAAVDVTAHTLAGDVAVFDQKEGGFSATLRFTTPGYESAARRLRLRVSQVFGDLEVHS